MTPQKTITPRAWAELFLLAAIWGASFISNRLALNEVGVLTTVAFRVGGACLLLWLWVAAKGLAVPRDPRLWGAFLVMGLLNNAIPFTLITWGQLTIPSGLAAILNASTALMGVLLASVVFRDERLTGQRLSGVVLGFMGVTVVIGWQALTALDLTSVAQLALLCASFSYACAGSWARKTLGALPPQVAAAGMLTGSSLLMIPAALLIEGAPSLTHGAGTWGALAYLAIVSTAGAYLLYYRLLGMAGAGNLSLVTLLVAPFAILLGALVLDEALPTRAYAGFALIAAGLLVIDGRILPRKDSRVNSARPFATKRGAAGGDGRMIYQSAAEWQGAAQKRVLLFGMSGLGKTHLANLLRDQAQWFHYSIDYRIGTRYMGEFIADNFKREAMKVPLLRELLMTDSVYIASNITFDNLAPLSTYLGKPGDPAKGGVPFAEYLRRQAQHREAEIAALLDTPRFIDRALDLYGYRNFVCDSGGSICEVLNPSDPADPVMTTLSNAMLMVWLKGSEAHRAELIRRFDRAPKPIYYQPDFLAGVWADYLTQQGHTEDTVDPDAFLRFAYARLLDHRQPRYAAMARWGVTVTAEEVAEVTDAAAFTTLIARALERRGEDA